MVRDFGGDMRPASTAGPVIVTDSAASLPQEIIDRFGVVVVPLSLVIGGVLYADGELDPDEVLRRIHAEPVTTSAPSPGDFVKAVDESERERGVLILTVASKMSAAYSAASNASRYFDPGVVRVVDTGTAAGAQGLVVQEAAERAAEGASLDEVVAVAEQLSARVRLIASVEDLDYLARSGRVPNLAARAGKSLSLRPLFEFSRGQVKPMRPAVGDRGVVGRLLDSVAGGRQDGGRLHAAVLHAHAASLAEEIHRRIAEMDPDAAMFEAPFSSVMVAHTGPGLIGVAWWREDPAPPDAPALPAHSALPDPPALPEDPAPQEGGVNSGDGVATHRDGTRR